MPRDRDGCGAIYAALALGKCSKISPSILRGSHRCSKSRQQEQLDQEERADLCMAWLW
jgi:hypothetical protein